MIFTSFVKHLLTAGLCRYFNLSSFGVCIGSLLTIQKLPRFWYRQIFTSDHSLARTAKCLSLKNCLKKETCKLFCVFSHPVLPLTEILPKRLFFYFFRLLLEAGASRNILTDQGERPIDLVDPSDMKMIAVMLSPPEKKR